MEPTPSGSPTCLGRLVIAVFILASLGGAYYLLFMRNQPGVTTGNTPTQPGLASQPAATGQQVKIGISYGTEKKTWLLWAAEQFKQTEAARRIEIELLPMGSLEGAQALLSGDKRINVWTPASAIYKDTFVQDWQIKYNTNPIAREETLALSPMVFVMWQERYDAFIQKYKTLNFKSVGQALQEKSGWEAIAQKSEWGLFKFGHTHPNQSNSGLATLLLMAAEFNNVAHSLSMKELLDPAFQTWMQSVERAASTQSNSTGNLMKEMVLKGPSSFDAVFVYESVAIDYVKGAEGRWGSLRVVYPEKNMWNDNPYYIIDATWSSKEQRKAAGEFLDFLLSEPIQRQSLTHGFRPGNTQVPVRGPDSPFNQLQKNGLSVDISTVVEPPKAEIINNLLQSWQRTQGGK